MAVKFGILALLEAKNDKGPDLQAFLEGGRAIAAAEEGTVTCGGCRRAAVGRTAEAGLAAIDSTYWLVGGPAPLIRRVADRFRSVDERSTDDWLRADD